MNKMNFDKALNILGLTKNYTEEDLKKAYRRLMTKYHPDKWEGKTEAEKKMAEEKAKEINAAKDFLEKNKRTSTNNNNNRNKSTYYTSAYEYVVLIKTKANIIKELKNYKNELIMLITPEEILLLKAIKELKKIVYEYIDKITNAEKLVDLDKYIIEFKVKIGGELEKFKIEYCKKHNINAETTKLEKYSLKKLYEELKKLRNEQNKNTSILDIIEEEYTLYAGYNVIKEKIKEIKKQILNEYKEGIFTEEEAKKKFGTKILLELREYYRRLEVINHFKSLGYKDKTIRAIIELMEESITTDKETFKIYEKRLTNYIAEKETRKTTKNSTKKIDYNHTEKIIKKDYFIKEDYNIKDSVTASPKYKIKKNI